MVLYKQGDDVRQDELALQLVRFMDRTLKGSGLDLRLVTYEVLAMGPREVPRTVKECNMLWCTSVYQHRMPLLLRLFDRIASYCTLQGGG